MLRNQTDNCRQPTNEGGFALITTVWIVLLLSLLAGAVLALSINARKGVATQEETSKYKFLADSAVDIFMHRYFFDEDELAHSNAVFQLLDYKVEVSVSYEKGRFNLNEEPREVLSAIFAANGMDAGQSQSIADAIIDWRDEDSISSELGAESVDYYAAELGHVPRNGWFESVGELQYVYGIEPETFRCALPMLTVYSKRATRADIGFADRSVRAVFEWAYSKNWLDQVWPNPDDNPSQIGLSQIGASIAGNALRLIVKVEKETIYSYETIVRFLSSSAVGVQFETIVPLRPLFAPQTTDNCALW